MCSLESLKKIPKQQQKSRRVRKVKSNLKWKENQSKSKRGEENW